MRKVLHLDMDAFFAAVEQRDRPELRGLPVAVGWSGGRGVVMTASYEARRFGVGSAMPSGTARRLCPDLVFVPGRMEVYREVSRQVMAIFRRVTGLVEPMSLDEAYLDVSDPLLPFPSATETARWLKRAVLEETGLTVSAGVSVNKFLAKQASGLGKPDGLTVIRPKDAPAFLAALPIERFHGVGPATARKMRAAGIATGADVQALPEAEMVRLFGKAGGHYWRIAAGRDDRPVTPDRERKSVGVETTFERDLAELGAMVAVLAELAAKLERRIGTAGVRPRSVTLKIKDRRFRVQTRTRSLEEPAVRADELLAIGRDLLRAHPPGEPVRLLGLTVSNFAAEGEGQLRLDLG